MKLWKKILMLFVIWAITYPLGVVIYPTYLGRDFAVIMGYAKWEYYSEVARHAFGYSVIGFFFGWFAPVMGIIDEVSQIFLKGRRVFQWIDMFANIIGALIGMGIARFIKISWRER